MPPSSLRFFVTSLAITFWDCGQVLDDLVYRRAFDRNEPLFVDLRKLDLGNSPFQFPLKHLHNSLHALLLNLDRFGVSLGLLESDSEFIIKRMN